jgi:hypothetical protein
MKLKVLSATSVVVACLLLSVATAGARTQLSYTPPATTSAGSAIPFTYRATGLPAGAKIALQRQEGTAHVWRTVLRLRTDHRASSLPALPLGIYRSRLAAFTRRGKLIASKSADLHVFGNEALASLLLEGSGGNHTTPTGIFSYATEANDSFGATNVLDLRRPNTCNSIHLDLMPGAANSDSDPTIEGLFSYTGTVTLVQESADPVSQTAAFDQVGSVNASVAPGQPWAVNIAQANTAGPNNVGLGFYFNGYGICD